MDAGANLQILLVSAVVAVLVTRTYLGLTGYPRMGGGSLHIAHLLFGGLLMLAGLVVLVALIGKRARRLASIVGGLGFGLFIDELGKFITADNDYFFQPTIALIYVVFVVLFLAFRAIERRSLSSEELLVNAAAMLCEVILGGATRAEIVRASRLLDRSGCQGPLADALRHAIDSATRVPERRSLVALGAARAWHAYDRLLQWSGFQRAIWLVFVGQACVGLVTTTSFAWAAVQDGAPMFRSLAQNTLGTSVLSLALVVIGVARLPTSRLAAYRWFEPSVLISVFFTQVIMFWQDQMTALGGLGWDLALLGVLRYGIRQEEARLVTER